MTTQSIKELEAQIEKLVREHMAACEIAAQAAVRRAFASRVKAQRPKVKKRMNEMPASRRPQRSSEEMTEAKERFYAAVCAKPGETMRVLAAEVGLTTRQLERPVAALKRERLVRSIGNGRNTRYFPMSPPTPTIQ
jgi:predicted Zn-dependent protease